MPFTSDQKPDYPQKVHFFLTLPIAINGELKIRGQAALRIERRLFTIEKPERMALTKRLQAARLLPLKDDSRLATWAFESGPCAAGATQGTLLLLFIYSNEGQETYYMKTRGFSNVQEATLELTGIRLREDVLSMENPITLHPGQERNEPELEAMRLELEAMQSRLEAMSFALVEGHAAADLSPLAARRLRNIAQELVQMQDLLTPF
ncbi:MAG: hypothetical protein IPJ71_19630 [Bdellovibrionales bacterium]|nr:hypothetical protein [Bdellovibrionales bacterium]